MGRNINPRKQRHLRVRKKISGTPKRPRLNVFRSANHIYAQLVDDSKNHTLVSASTLDEAVKAEVSYGGNKEAAKVVGRVLAEKAQKAGISTVIFDRGGFIYHGRIKELADAARETGLEF
ncbi:MAG TPA: 50S ribosomal protein L18 [Firmicutes bacterium]|nr:50S ribosomal protein L18 [Bacillota bacterium]